MSGIENGIISLKKKVASEIDLGISIEDYDKQEATYEMLSRTCSIF